MQSSSIYHYIYMMQQKNHKFEILMENSWNYFHFASFWHWPFNFQHNIIFMKYNLLDYLFIFVEIQRPST